MWLLTEETVPDGSLFTLNSRGNVLIQLRAASLGMAQPEKLGPVAGTA